MIAQEDVAQCLAVFKSRRNLAARLAKKLFTTEDKFGSNCRGAGGKTALNFFKVQAIFVTWSKHYPLDWLETDAQQRGKCVTRLMKCAGRPRLM